MRVPPDLTTGTLYKYMVLRLLFPLHYSWHCYVQTESNTAQWQLCARGIGGKRLFEGNGRDTCGIVRFRQGIERGYRSENGLSVRMFWPDKTSQHLLNSSPLWTTRTKSMCLFHGLFAFVHLYSHCLNHSLPSCVVVVKDLIAKILSIVSSFAFKVNLGEKNHETNGITWFQQY
jgi:hypothetical protein